MKLYFLGIGGIAMGNVAVAASRHGHEVYGVDRGIYSPMRECLTQAQIPVFEGYDAVHLETIRPDLVIIGNSIPRNNPEIEALLSRPSCRFTSLPEFIRNTFLIDRKTFVVAGTHGKTTTSALLSFLLQQSGLDIGYMIGGVAKNFTNTCRYGSPKTPFVIEGDEYDSAFFDKRSKFVHYWPDVAIINAIEFDHADIFCNLEEVLRSFRYFTRTFRPQSTLLLNGDDPHCEALLPIPWTTVYRIGFSEKNDLQIKNLREQAPFTCFDLVWQNSFWTTIKWPLMGEFNARNAAMASLAAALHTYPQNPTAFDLNPLKQFRGVKRRQDTLFASPQLQVIEDFGHHPTAIASTLKAIKNRFPEHKICACFEPRTRTTSLNLFQEAFVQAFLWADLCFLGEIYFGQDVPQDRRIDLEKLVLDLRQHNKKAIAFPSNEHLLDHLQQLELDQPMVVCFFSNGGFNHLPQRYTQYAQSLFQNC